MGQLANLLSASATLSGGLSYYEYEYQIAEQVVIPWLAKRMTLAGLSVGDFGCHQGGVLAAFREQAHIISGTGYDLNEDSIRQTPFVRDAQFQLKLGNILELDPAESQFDLILIRDVLEHIPDTEATLRKAKACLKPGGKLFVSFPPYYSPFGGHQQVSANWAKLVPYLHYLPAALLFKLVRLEDNAYMSATDSLGDMTSVREARLTLSRCEHVAKAIGLKTASRQYFLLRPEFQVRYGIPALDAGPLGIFPGLREILTMGVFYLFENR